MPQTTEYMAKKRLTLITQIHNMLSRVCSDSNHTGNHEYHQIKFMTNIEHHNKTLRKHRETVKNNHEHSESTSKFISNDCIQLYSWTPQSFQFFSSVEISRHNRETLFRSSNWV